MATRVIWLSCWFALNRMNRNCEYLSNSFFYYYICLHYAGFAWITSESFSLCLWSDSFQDASNQNFNIDNFAMSDFEVPALLPLSRSPSPLFTLCVYCTWTDSFPAAFPFGNCSYLASRFILFTAYFFLPPFAIDSCWVANFLFALAPCFLPHSLSLYLAELSLESSVFFS